MGSQCSSAELRVCTVRSAARVALKQIHSPRQGVSRGPSPRWPGWRGDPALTENCLGQPVGQTTSR